jgi:hypothetical protein
VISLSNVRGKVRVRGEERADILVEAVKRSGVRANPKHTVIDMWQDEDRVFVKTRHRDGSPWLSWLFGDRMCAVDYDVAVPRGCGVRARQVEGLVEVVGVDGWASVDVVDGVVKMDEVSGRARVKAVSAHVEGHRWVGRANVETVSGSVRLVSSQLLDLKANTVSGDLSLETSLDDAGRYSIKSVSGDAVVYLPEGQGVESQGKTLSGGFRCDIPHTVRLRGRGRWRVTVNGGGPGLRFNSVSGDLRLTQQPNGAVA